MKYSRKDKLLGKPERDREKKIRKLLAKDESLEGLIRRRRTHEERSFYTLILAGLFGFIFMVGILAVRGEAMDDRALDNLIENQLGIDSDTWHEIEESARSHYEHLFPYWIAYLPMLVAGYWCILAFIHMSVSSRKRRKLEDLLLKRAARKEPEEEEGSE